MERHQERRFSQGPRRYGRSAQDYMEPSGPQRRRRESYSMDEDLQDYEDSFRNRAEYDEDIFERDYRAEQPYRQPYRAGRYGGPASDYGRSGSMEDYRRSGEPKFRERDRSQDFSGRGPKGYRRSDDRITEELNERLTQDHNVDATDIEVKVENGEVTLSGTVGDRRAKRMAEDIADEISGVIDVHNSIKVKREETSGARLESNKERKPAKDMKH